MANVIESLRKHHKGELIDSVKMHLSFLIDVTPEEWERIVYYVDREAEEAEKASATSSGKLTGKNSSQTKYFTSISTSSANSLDGNGAGGGGGSTTNRVNSKFAPPKEKELASNIFGNPLSRESLRQAMILVDFLNDEDNYKLEGIFRKSGTQERQQDLRYMLNNGVRVDLKANRFTPVDVSCVLKEFIQKLPEPLLTTNHFELYYELTMTIKKETPIDEIETKNAKRLKIVQLLLQLMPELNRGFFMSLMALLNRVALAVEVTKMDERSLATIFGQHILCPRSWTPKQMQKNIEIITDAMEFLLINYDKLFSGPAELVLDAKKKIKKYQISGSKKVANSSGDELEPSLLCKLNKGNNNHSSSSTSNNNYDNEESDENNTVITFCQRREPQDTITDQALAELYAQVQAMPETSHKRKLIKQFNKQNGFGTPMQVTSRQSSTSNSTSKWKSLLPPILRPKH